MSAAAVIILRRKKFIRRFRERRATSPDHAIPFAQVGIRRSWVFDQMLRRGVFSQVEADRYYLNEKAANEFLTAQRTRGLIVAGVLLLVLLVFLAASARW